MIGIKLSWQKKIVITAPQVAARLRVKEITLIFFFQNEITRFVFASRVLIYRNLVLISNEMDGRMNNLESHPGNSDRKGHKIFSKSFFEY